MYYVHYMRHYNYEWHTLAYEDFSDAVTARECLESDGHIHCHITDTPEPWEIEDYPITDDTDKIPDLFD